MLNSSLFLDPVLVKDINPGSDSSNPRYLTNVNGIVFFTSINNATNRVELWKSDGTLGGTILLNNFNQSNIIPLLSHSEN